MVIIFPVGRVDVVRRRHALAACKTLGIPSSKPSTLRQFFPTTSGCGAQPESILELLQTRQQAALPRSRSAAAAPSSRCSSLKQHARLKPPAGPPRDGDAVAVGRRRRRRRPRGERVIPTNRRVRPRRPALRERRPSELIWSDGFFRKIRLLGDGQGRHEGPRGQPRVRRRDAALESFI